MNNLKDMLLSNIEDTKQIVENINSYVFTLADLDHDLTDQEIIGNIDRIVQCIEDTAGNIGLPGYIEELL